MPDDRRQAIRDLVNEWMRRAQSDLVLAQMTEEERIAPEILAFHAQQAAEKALKALLVKLQVDFPNTHSIGLLLNLCQKAGFGATDEIAGVATLTRYAVTSRYPGENEPVSRQEAKEAADLAARVFFWIEALIAGKP